MGVAAKYAFAIVVLLFCFTAGPALMKEIVKLIVQIGFGLRCFLCTSVQGRRDDCNLGRGMPEQICDAVVLWGEIAAASAMLASTDTLLLHMPDHATTTQMGNVACIKMIYKNSSGEDQIGRSCTFKMYDGVDGCGVAERLVDSLRIRDDTNYYRRNHDLANLTGEMAKMYPKPAHCRVCYTDLCNATIGLTPALFVYSSLCLLILIKCNLFLQ